MSWLGAVLAKVIFLLAILGAVTPEAEAIANCGPAEATGFALTSSNKLPNVLLLPGPAGFPAPNPSALTGWAEGDLYIISSVPITVSDGLVTSPGGSIYIRAPRLTVAEAGFISTSSGVSMVSTHISPAISGQASVHPYSSLGATSSAGSIHAVVDRLIVIGCIATGNGWNGASMEYSIDVHASGEASSIEGEADADPNGVEVHATINGQPVDVGPLAPDVLSGSLPLAGGHGGNGGSIFLDATTDIDVSGTVRAGSGGFGGKLDVIAAQQEVAGGTGGNGGTIWLLAAGLVSSGTLQSGMGGPGGPVTDLRLQETDHGETMGGNGGAGGSIAISAAILSLGGTIATGNGGLGGYALNTGGWSNVAGGRGGMGGHLIIPTPSATTSFSQFAMPSIDLADGGDGGVAVGMPTPTSAPLGVLGGRGGDSGMIVTGDGMPIMSPGWPVAGGSGGDGADAGSFPGCVLENSHCWEWVVLVLQCLDVFGTVMDPSCLLGGVAANGVEDNNCSTGPHNLANGRTPYSAPDGKGHPFYGMQDGVSGTHTVELDGESATSTMTATGGDGGLGLLSGGKGGAGISCGYMGGNGAVGQRGGNGNFFDASAGHITDNDNAGDGGAGGQGGNGGDGQDAGATGGNGGAAFLGCGGEGGSASATGGNGGNAGIGGDGGKAARSYRYPITGDTDDIGTSGAGGPTNDHKGVGGTADALKGTAGSSGPTCSSFPSDGTETENAGSNGLLDGPAGSAGQGYIDYSDCDGLACSP